MTIKLAVTAQDIFEILHTKIADDPLLTVSDAIKIPKHPLIKTTEDKQSFKFGLIALLSQMVVEKRLLHDALVKFEDDVIH